MWPTRLQSQRRLDRRAQLVAAAVVGVLFLITVAFTWLSMQSAGRHGGAGSSVVPAPRLWDWDGHSYIEMRAGGGGPLSTQIDVAYDRARNVLVAWDHGCTRLVMGFTGGCAERVDRTWIWNGSWKLQPGALQPDEPGRGAIFFDGQAAEVLYVNGAGAGWGWNGGAWRRLRLPGAPAVPRPGSSSDAGFAAGYDEYHQQLVFVLPNRTWTFDGTSWSAHVGSIDAAELRGGGQLVDDGGGLLYLGKRSTWTWDGSRWAALGQTGIVDAGLAYDAAEGTVVAVAQDASVWNWSDGNWRQAVIPSRPPVRGLGVPPVAYVEATGVMVLL